MDFVIAGLAASVAGTFTNPLEVIKVRMQLQGELAARGQHVIVYKNVLHATYVIAKTDGILALQKGLVSAVWVQFIMNGSRLGFYEMIYSRGYVFDSKGKMVLWKSILLGGIGGVIGQYLSNPFYLIKTRLQSQAAKSIAVGHQHEHKGTWDALKKIYIDHGVKGLFRGGVATIPRAFAASTAQMTSFAYTKEWLNQYSYFSESPMLKSFVGSMIGGIAISVVVPPFDLVLIRLYNQGVNAQGKGLLYNGYFDCIVKVYKTEGLLAFFKGVGPMYFRLGPHSMLCLTFWDGFKMIYENYILRRNRDTTENAKK